MAARSEHIRRPSVGIRRFSVSPRAVNCDAQSARARSRAQGATRIARNFRARFALRRAQLCFANKDKRDWRAPAGLNSRVRIAGIGRKTTMRLKGFCLALLLHLRLRSRAGYRRRNLPAKKPRTPRLPRAGNIRASAKSMAGASSCMRHRSAPGIDFEHFTAQVAIEILEKDADGELRRRRHFR